MSHDIGRHGMAWHGRISPAAAAPCVEEGSEPQKGVSAPVAGVPGVAVPAGRSKRCANGVSPTRIIIIQLQWLIDRAAATKRNLVSRSRCREIT